MMPLLGKQSLASFATEDHCSGSSAAWKKNPGHDQPSLACRFSETGHIEFDISKFRFFQEGQSKGGIVNFRRLGFFINPIQSEGELELDLAKVGSPSTPTPLAPHSCPF